MEQKPSEKNKCNEGRVLLIVEYGYPDGDNAAKHALINACSDGILKQPQCRTAGLPRNGGYTECSGICYSNE